MDQIESLVASNYWPIIDQLFPTKDCHFLKDGLSLKLKKWEEFLKYANEMYGERLELFRCTPCLVDPTQADHDSLTCRECSVVNQESKRIVGVDIPL